MTKYKQTKEQNTVYLNSPEKWDFYGYKCIIFSIFIKLVSTNSAMTEQHTILNQLHHTHTHTKTNKIFTSLCGEQPMSIGRNEACWRPK